MTRPSAQLDHLQHWLLDAITNPLAPRSNDVQQIILPSQNQSAADRLAVYRNAYLARLLEVLREQFPGTRYAVGDELFDQFAAGYLQGHPPHSYTLAHLADNLADHLDTTRPAEWGEFLVELARLEQAIDRVFDAPGPEHLPPFTIPADADDSLHLALAPGFELLAFNFPVSTYYTAWKAGQQPAWPSPQPQFIALLRRDYIVRRHELSQLQHQLLFAISRGLPLGEALAAATQPPDTPHPDDLAQQLRHWFTTWASQGFFVARDH